MTPRWRPSARETAADEAERDEIADALVRFAERHHAAVRAALPEGDSDE